MIINVTAAQVLVSSFIFNRNKVADDHRSQNMVQILKESNWTCSPGRPLRVWGLCLLCDRQGVRSGAGTQPDRFFRFLKLAISFNERFNFNERLSSSGVSPHPLAPVQAWPRRCSARLDWRARLADTHPQSSDLPPNHSWFVPPPHSYLLSYLLICFIFSSAVSPSYSNEAVISLRHRAVTVLRPQRRPTREGWRDEAEAGRVVGEGRWLAWYKLY